MTRTTVLSFAIALVTFVSWCQGCPYCEPGEGTLTEELNASDAAVIAQLLKPGKPLDYGPDSFGEFGNVDPDAGKATFKIVDRLRGDDLLVGIDEIQAVYFGEPKKGELYLLTAIAEPLDWAVPLPVSGVAADYIRNLDQVPAGGAPRLEYFLAFLQHEDPLLALDAYEEFALAPYADVIALSDKLDRDKLKAWIEDPTVSPNRRSLYFTLLGVCGNEEDIAWLERMMLADRRMLVAGTEAGGLMALGGGGGLGLIAIGDAVAMEENRKKLGFNALVGCYLKLRGEAGLKVIDEYFLSDPSADYTQVFASVQALTFAAEETDEFSMDRIKESMRLVLTNPDFAERAIINLARWEDWTVTERLIEMFREPDQFSWTRQSIVAYLDLAAEQEGPVSEQATKALAEFEQLDPKSVKNARALAEFGFLGSARGGSVADGKTVPPNAVRPTAQADVDEQDGDNVGDEQMTVESAVDTIVGETDAPPEPVAESESSDQVEPTSTSQSETVVHQPEIEESTIDAAEVQKSAENKSLEQPASRAATTSSGSVEEHPEPPSTVMLVGLPIGGAFALMALFYIVLRSGI